jgi:hypothetical protein
MSMPNSAQTFVGHGEAINELKYHPLQSHLLLSVSKGLSLR